MYIHAAPHYGVMVFLTDRIVAGDASPAIRVTPITLYLDATVPEEHRFFQPIAICLVSRRLPMLRGLEQALIVHASTIENRALNKNL